MASAATTSAISSSIPSPHSPVPRDLRGYSHSFKPSFKIQFPPPFPFFFPISYVNSFSSILTAAQIGKILGIQLKGYNDKSNLKRRWAVHAVDPAKRNESVVAAAASATAAMVEEAKEKAKVEDYENLAAELEGSSPLEIMDRALEMFGNDIAIAFR